MQLPAGGAEEVERSEGVEPPQLGEVEVKVLIFSLLLFQENPSIRRSP